MDLYISTSTAVRYIQIVGIGILLATFLTSTQIGKHLWFHYFVVFFFYLFACLLNVLYVKIVSPFAFYELYIIGGTCI